MENAIKYFNSFDALNESQEIPPNILFADDEKPIRQLIFKILNTMGFGVALAVNGRAALSMFVEGDFNLVITDFDMPFMDGLLLATHIKRISPETPIILVTGCESEVGMQELEIKRSLFFSILFKPFSKIDLKNAIEGALAFS